MNTPPGGPTPFRGAVVEAPADLVVGSEAWERLCEHVRRQAPDLLLLNEMPFGPWIAARESFDRATWLQSCEQHERGIARLAELGAATVAASRPVEVDGQRVNQAFLWNTDDGLKPVHTKQYFPDEPGYYEDRWFAGGRRDFLTSELPLPLSRIRAGFLLCTEVMFNEHARQYGRDGAHVILVPRAVGFDSLPRWLTALQMAAIVSGCYVLSSNRAGHDARGQRFGGRGFAIDPGGDLIGQTSEPSPVAVVTIDSAFVHQAQRAYPCYVRE